MLRSRRKRCSISSLCSTLITAVFSYTVGHVCLHLKWCCCHFSDVEHSQLHCIWCIICSWALVSSS